MSDQDDGNREGGPKVIYEDDVERQWSEASSIQGVDPSLLHARLRRHRAEDLPEAASFSPILIPYAAIMTGPIIAAVLTIFADGNPPRARQAVSILCLGAIAWVLNFGLASMEYPLISPGGDAALHLAVLFVSGALFWALYTFWIKGSRRFDQQGLSNSAVLFIALSAIFWIGRDATWLTWLGR